MGPAEHLATATTSPQTVSGLTDAVTLASQGEGYCALLSTGGVDCWGATRPAIWVTGPRVDPKRRLRHPQAVTGITDAVSVTSDDDGYCAVLSTGGADCWGATP